MKFRVQPEINDKARISNLSPCFANIQSTLSRLTYKSFVTVIKFLFSLFCVHLARGQHAFPVTIPKKKLSLYRPNLSQRR